MKSKITLLLLIISSSYTSTIGYKILLACPIPVQSHNNLCRGILDILLERNHEVTFINPLPKNESGFREIAIPQSMQSNMVKKELLNTRALANKTSIERIYNLNKLTSFIAENILNMPEIQNLLDDKNEKFDLLIMDFSFGEYLLGFSVHFNCPAIVLSTLNSFYWLSAMTDNPHSLATVPNIFSPYSNNMNLWQRIINVGYAITQEIMTATVLTNTQKNIYNKYFPKEAKKVPFDELKYKIASTLINSHPSMGIVRPFLPNTIEVAGFHMKNPEPLPKDLELILNSAKEGVIYFSLGSGVKSRDMDLDIISAILKVFASRKETFLWKFEEELPDRSENVIIKNWLPQTGILAHPNVKLFISHGGLLSCTEATYFGKPLLVIPVFGDQYHNAQQVTERGQGLYLHYNNITDVSLAWTLDELVTNKKYFEAAQRSQRLFHDRPISPRNLVAFQIEHVIRTNGAVHLAPPKLPRYSQLLIDVIFLVSLPLLILLYCILTCTRWSSRKICFMCSFNNNGKIKQT